VSTDTRALREVVGGPDFRSLMGVRVCGQFADGLFQAALFSAVFFNPERATSAGQAAAGFATLLLPYSVVGPFAGVLLDRWRRQRILLLGNLVRAAVVVVFATLLALLGPTSPPVVALALLAVSVNRFILSGLSAALPHVVAERLLVTANSFSTTVGAGAAALGGATAVALRLVFGEDDLGASRTALVAAALYVVAGVLAGRIAPSLLGPDDPPCTSGCARPSAPSRAACSRARATCASGGPRPGGSPPSARTASSTGCPSSRRCCCTPSRAPSDAASPGWARSWS
jgi:MFS family permease